MQARESFERLLAWLVPIAIAAFVLSTAAFTFLDSELWLAVADSLGITPGALKAGIRFLQSLLLGASALVSGVWLAFQPHAATKQRVLWGLFGLTSGLLAIAIWFAIQIHDRLPPRAGD